MKLISVLLIQPGKKKKNVLFAICGNHSETQGQSKCRDLDSSLKRYIFKITPSPNVQRTLQKWQCLLTVTYLTNTECLNNIFIQTWLNKDNSNRHVKLGKSALTIIGPQSSTELL